ncbi:kinase-like domain-containing protein [Neurospora crassa]|nr:kinase-like domain-containing protein [Neurospora crassa]
MVFTFSNEYAAALADTTLLKTNKYYSTLSTNVKRNPSGALMFREVEIGISYSTLQRLVVNAVTASATRTATRTASSIRKPGNDSSPNSKLPGIGEEEEGDEDDEDDEDANEIETVLPQWEESDWFDETLSMQGFSLNVNHGANTLNEMMERDNNDGLTVLSLTVHKRRRPFAKGNLRMASYARTVSSTNPYVAKSFIKKAPQLAYLVEEMRFQALCKAFALEFNALLVDSPRHSIDFIVTACFKGKSELKSGDEFISIEPYIGVDYVKYNGNAGGVNDSKDPSNEAAQAFSHFTFERSRGAFLACDLQGVNGLLTDPAVHTRDEDRFPLSETNLGVDGFKFFFSTHECNDICRKLGLKTNGWMVVSGNYDFRSDWPNLPNTLCCSNKLCGKILRRADIIVSEKYPGYRWCGMCFPQLESTTEMEVCRADAPYHQFELSRFFHESQGQRIPRMCPDHDDEQNRYSMFMAMPATPAMLGGLAGAGAGTGGDVSMLSSMAAPSKPAASKTTQADASLLALWEKLESATVNLEDD